MKQFRILTTLYVAACTLVLFSCGGGEEKKADEPGVAADTAVAKTTEPAAPAPAAKPSNVLIIMHKVANFGKWMPLYESHDSVRQAYGLHNYVVARGVNDSNTVMIALRMDDAAKAKQFAALPDLKTVMQKGGVKGVPSFKYLDVQMMDSSANALPTRVLLTHKVKDWDAWKKEFDSHKQVRIDAGLTDRAVAYSVGDNHQVSVVCVVSDLKKAEAFFKSADLKEKMTKAGVEGAPTIFYYNVVKKY